MCDLLNCWQACLISVSLETAIVSHAALSAYTQKLTKTTDSGARLIRGPSGKHLGSIPLLRNRETSHLTVPLDTLFISSQISL